ncbi:hypothetical protein [Lentzea sp. CA-135723]|uniref:hypothetical protein n=1 Tax=Lentzea sp. CA-135723 TaxID=3239950 RepID=UPI003D8A1B60
MTAGLALYLSRSKSRLVIIDNYMNDEVVRWAAAPSGDPKITLIGKSFDATAMSEASAIASSGKTVTLIRHREIDDRWAVRDGDWLHSGHSFKDIGKKRSRLSPITNPAEIAEHEDMLLDLISTGEKVQLP